MDAAEAAEMEDLHRRQAELLRNPEVLKGLQTEACNRVMGLPEVQTLVEEQIRLLAGDPQVVRNLEPKGSVKDMGETSRRPTEDQDGPAHIEDVVLEA